MFEKFKAEFKAFMKGPDFVLGYFFVAILAIFGYTVLYTLATGDSTYTYIGCTAVAVLLLPHLFLLRKRYKHIDPKVVW